MNTSDRLGLSRPSAVLGLVGSQQSRINRGHVTQEAVLLCSPTSSSERQSELHGKCKGNTNNGTLQFYSDDNRVHAE